MRDPTPSPYTWPTTLHVVESWTWTELPVTFEYAVSDPFAVRITFGASGRVAWLLSRDLLRSALDHPAGDGDVRLWPSRTAGDALFLQLRAPSGQALFEMSRPELADFLRLTDTAVAPGEEDTAADIDTELAALLADHGSDPETR